MIERGGKLSIGVIKEAICSTTRQGNDSSPKRARSGFAESVNDDDGYGGFLSKILKAKVFFFTPNQRRDGSKVFLSFPPLSFRALGFEAISRIFKVILAFEFRDLRRGFGRGRQTVRSREVGL